MASITYQNYFRLYQKLSGMTETAMTEAEEFLIYISYLLFQYRQIKKCCVKILTIRYLELKKKYNAITNKIIECNKKGQPVLVGTTSIEKSEKISSFLENKKINHSVLNAKQHKKEASIIAGAGKIGAVTIATNMVGRGTDIKLGGNKDFIFDGKKKTRKI